MCSGGHKDGVVAMSWPRSEMVALRATSVEGEVENEKKLST